MEKSDSLISTLEKMSQLTTDNLKELNKNFQEYGLTEDEFHGLMVILLDTILLNGLAMGQPISVDFIKGALFIALLRKNKEIAELEKMNG
jgi:hypothetical protein